MRTRDAWLAAIAAALGISEEACRAKDTAPAAAREIPSASASASAPIVATTAPSASAEIAPSASASAIASASAAPKASEPDLAKLLGDPNLAEQLQASCGAPGVRIPSGPIGSIGIGTIGTGHNLSCGVSINQLRGSNKSPRAEVNVVSTGGAAGDDRVATALRARFRNCANQALQQNPTQQGRLTIVANISATGAVTNATVASNSGLSASCADCMLRSVRSAQFPAGAQRTISIAINQTTQQSP